MKMSPYKRLAYALIVSATLQALFFIAIVGGEGGRQGPLKMPGILFVELIKLSAKGVEAKMAEHPTVFAQDLCDDEDEREREPAPALNLEMNEGEEPINDRSTSPRRDPSSESRAGLKHGESEGAEPTLPKVDPGNNSPSGEARETYPGDDSADPDPTRPICNNCPPPDYPPQAQERGIEGEVSLRVEVLPDGMVGDIFVVSSSGFPILDEAALAQVKTWTFRPAENGDEAATMIQQVTIPFTLPSP